MNRFVHLLSYAAVGAFFVINFAVSTGCGVPTIAVSPPGGGGGGGTTPGTPLTKSGAVSAYAVYDGGPAATPSTVKSILQFALTTTGAVAPSGSLTMPANFSPSSVTVDSTGQIYVGGGFATTPLSSGNVLVYAAGATGAATPVRTINGFPTLAAPTRMAVDSAGLLYVLFGNVSPGIFEVFSATANGAATPLRTVTGPLTQLGNVTLDIRVDASGNIYVPVGLNATNTQVLVFSATADGNAAPTRVLSGANTTFSGIFGIDLDSSNNLYVLNEPASSTSTEILEFASGASGNVAPTRTIAGSNTGLGFLHAIHVDAVGNIYVLGVVPANINGTPYIAAFSSAVSGNVAPAISFTSTAWPISDSYDFAVR